LRTSTTVAMMGKKSGFLESNSEVNVNVIKIPSRDKGRNINASGNLWRVSDFDVG